LHEVLRQADFVITAPPLNDDTRGMIGQAEFACMKPTAFIINTSRGPIINEAALLSVLGQRKIAGAGLDTFDVEPLPVSHPLRRLDNVVITPHLGYVSQEGYKIYFTQMVEEIKAHQQTVYLVHMQDEFTWKILRISDGEMSIIEDFNKN